jgi:hypothetical protein
LTLATRTKPSLAGWASFSVALVATDAADSSSESGHDGGEGLLFGGPTDFPDAAAELP